MQWVKYGCFLFVVMLIVDGTDVRPTDSLSLSLRMEFVLELFSRTVSSRKVRGYVQT
jgi:hypothetical protein